MNVTNRDLYSDAHKDAYGFRPSGDKMKAIRAMSDAEFDKEWDSVVSDVERSIENEKAEHQAAQRDWRAHIAKIVVTHCVSRRVAIRWDMSSQGLNHRHKYDVDHYRFNCGLPFSYHVGV